MLSPVGLCLAYMTSAHFIYIPGVLVLGAVFGYVAGGRAAESAKVESAQRERRRQARRARRDRGEPRLEG